MDPINVTRQRQVELEPFRHCCKALRPQGFTLRDTINETAFSGISQWFIRHLGSEDQFEAGAKGH